MLEIVLTHPSLKEASLLLGINESKFDKNFGIIKSEQDNTYVVLLDETVAAKIPLGKYIRGVHSNPRIEPFGPVT